MRKPYLVLSLLLCILPLAGCGQEAQGEEVGQDSTAVIAPPEPEPIAVPAIAPIASTPAAQQKEIASLSELLKRLPIQQMRWSLNSEGAFARAIQLHSSNGAMNAQLKLDSGVSERSSSNLDLILHENGRARDLSGLEGFRFEANIPEGHRFSISVHPTVGTSFGACSGELLGRGNRTYVVEFARLNHCRDGVTTMDASHVALLRISNEIRGQESNISIRQVSLELPKAERLPSEQKGSAPQGQI